MDYDTRGRLVAQVFYAELEKIAKSYVDPSDLVRGVKENLKLRGETGYGLSELLSPGPSLFGGIVHNIRNRLGGRKVKSEAFRELAKMKADVDPRKAQSLAEQNESLARLSEIRKAERELAGASPSGGRSFFSPKSSGPSSSPLKSSLSTAAFGAGAGVAGTLGAQQYLNSQAQGEPTY